MFAFLPMYDFPHLHRETDALWDEIYRACRARKIDAPKALTRRNDLHDAWLEPNMLLGQACGLPYVTELRGKVSILGSPIYDVPGCGQGTYSSVVIARNASLPARPTYAVNDLRSQSGYAALMRYRLADNQPMPRRSDIIMTGSHRRSIIAVAKGAADIAAIDCVTWALLKDIEPACDDISVIATTDATPALPMITAKPELQARLVDALQEAYEKAPEPLKIKGLMPFDDADYDTILTRYTALPLLTA